VYDGTDSRWENAAQSTITAGKATNLAGGSAGQVPYQSAADTTGFTSTGTAGQVLTSQGTSAPTWTTITASVAVTDDTTTNAARYPLFADVTSGSLSTTYVSSTKYQFNPSTGVLTATSFSGAGTGLTGTAGSLSIGGNAATATSATSATTATNLAGGANGSLPYQTGSGATTFLAAGTDGYILTQASGVPTWAAAPATGITIADDTTTNATRYITFTDATTGTETGLDVSSTKLQYNPSTGVVTATGFAGALNGTVGATTPTTATFTDVTLNGQGDLRFADSDSSNWVAFQGPATVSSNVTWTLPSADGTNGQVLQTNGSGTLSWATAGGGSGDVVGPASATDNAVARFDGTTGKLIQNSAASIDDNGAATFVGAVNVSGTSTAGSNIKFYEDTDNGTNYVSLKAPDTISADVTWTLPAADGTNEQVLKTNGSGTLSWVGVMDIIANASYGAVGTYAVLGSNVQEAVAPGDTKAGSNLRQAGRGASSSWNNANPSDGGRGSSSSESGTWRFVSRSPVSTQFAWGVWLRIS
jgi:hypothetical protein